MARIRTVKPEFFTHPEIVRLSIPARLLFVSLLTQADDEGRLYDQPRKIGSNAFGEEDEIEEKTLLDELKSKGRIARYEVDEKRCIQILNFDKHQVIAPSKRRNSSIPKQPRSSKRAANGQLDGSQTDARNGREQGTGNGRDLDHSATRPENNGALPLSTKDTSETLAQFFKDRGDELPTRSDVGPQGAYRALIETTERELGTRHPDRPWAIARIIAEYVEEGTNEKFNQSAESHLRRLVKSFGALPAFDQMHQGIIWGAGIDPKYADDPLSLTKYATKILSKEKS